MLSCICLLKHLSIYLLIYCIWNQKKKIKLSELNELKCSKTPSQMSSCAHKHVFLYLHAQTNINTLFYRSYTKLKKIKKIPFKFFIIKSLKIHSAKNICRIAFCLAPNERELSNLITLSISLEVGWVSQFLHEKMKTMFFSNMSKSWRLTSTFFPMRFNQ